MRFEIWVTIKGNLRSQITIKGLVERSDLSIRNTTRDWVKKGLITVKYLPTDEMPADVLTKPLSVEKVKRGRQMLGLV